MEHGTSHETLQLSLTIILIIAASPHHKATMSLRESTTPLLDIWTPSPSPAREALQGHLDNQLSLNKKKSWFGAARDVMHQGVLHAKGYVDLIRGEPSIFVKCVISE